MRAFDREELGRLLEEHREPCISLCMPTHRKFPESNQDPIKYGNLVRDVATSLEKKYGKRDAAASELLERLEKLGADGPDGEGGNEFWSHQRDGLAVFAAPGFFAWYSVPLPLRDITVVSDSFHVKPLLPLLFADRRFHVLALTQNDVQLFDCNSDHVEELPLHGVPRSLTEALGQELDTSRGITQRTGGSNGGPVVSGSGRPSDEEKKELRRYFRAVDKAIADRWSKPTGRPLILAALDYYHPLFHEVSSNPHVLERGISQDPKSMSPEQLREAGWKAFEPEVTARIEGWLDEFGAAQARRQASSDLQEVCSAAAAGRVRRLLVEERRRIWGRLDRSTGEVAVGGAPGNPDDADVLDDLAEVVLKHGGEVALLPPERMPSQTGLAATFRF